MKEKIDNKLCNICDNQLVLNYLVRGPDSGICDECGAMYSYVLGDTEISSVEFFTDFDLEKEVISDYYEETGRTAYIIGNVEYSEDDASEFLKWARENYPEFDWRKP